MSDIVKLTQAELDRAAIMQECIAGRLKNGQAAEQLDLSLRQVKRLKHIVQKEGAKGLASKQRGPQATTSYQSKPSTERGIC